MTPGERIAKEFSENKRDLSPAEQVFLTNAIDQTTGVMRGAILGLLVALGDALYRREWSEEHKEAYKKGQAAANGVLADASDSDAGGIDGWDTSMPGARARAALAPAAPATTEVAATGEGAWIPVGEKLPDEGEHVLGWDGVEVYQVERTSHGTWELVGTECLHDVTRWMPLPSAPAGPRKGEG